MSNNNKRMVDQLMCIITWSTYEWFSASTSIQMFLCFIHSFIYLFIHIRIDLFTWAKPQIVAVQKYWPPLLFSKHRLFDWGLFEVYSSRWVPGGGVGLCIGLLAKIGRLIFFFPSPPDKHGGCEKRPTWRLRCHPRHSVSASGMNFPRCKWNHSRLGQL